mmetsp:Transcript_11824/g.16351  ORF Transcript_11824/g.16351 Transcript_11824/m.16351 type:complete len:158 (-) Transcript_11824:453-926(-)
MLTLTFIRLSLIASLACAFTVPPPPFSIYHSTTRLNLYRSVEEAIEEAQRICATDPGSPECRVAWDIVEELEAANSHRGAPSSSAPVDASSPDLTALLYSFDILVKKIDGKMDQLKATTNKLQELGATDPSVGSLGERAEEMKNHLAFVRNYLNENV